MIGRVLGHVVHVLGNGRAVENARRSSERDRFAHERIDALGRRLPAVRTPARRPSAA